MFQIADEHTFEDGQIIWEEGTHGDWIYVVESGSVELSRKIKGQKVIIEILDKDAIFGEVGYIIKIPRLFTAQALGPTTLGIIDRDFLDQEYNRMSPTFKMILISITKRLIKETQYAGSGRASPRVPKVLSLMFKSRGQLIKAFSGNVSSGGLFIKTPMPLEVRERFSLKLHLPEGTEPLPIECEVAWNRKESQDQQKRPLGMGVKFIKMSDADRQRLQKELQKAEIFK
jgi:uncharacterized protein (TIGR02266 family)